MKPKLQKTTVTKPADIERKWYVIDAAGAPLGRLASEVAALLRGKHKPYFTDNLDCGDHVIVINAAEVAVTGRKAAEKVYYRHSGFPGGLRAETFERVRAKYPERIVESAVKGMLPKNKLGRSMLKKLKVYGGPDHPHASQRPEPRTLTYRKVDA